MLVDCIPTSIWMYCTKPAVMVMELLTIFILGMHSSFNQTCLLSRNLSVYSWTTAECFHEHLEAGAKTDTSTLFSFPPWRKSLIRLRHSIHAYNSCKKDCPKFLHIPKNSLNCYIGISASLNQTSSNPLRGRGE